MTVRRHPILSRFAAMAFLAWTFAAALPGGAAVAPAWAARTPEEAQGDLFQAEGLLVARQYAAAYERYKLLYLEFPTLSRVVEGYVRVLVPLQKWEELRGVITAERARMHSATFYARELVSADRALGRYDEALEEDVLWWISHPADGLAGAVADSVLLEANYSDVALQSLKRLAHQAPSHQGLRMLEIEALARSGHEGEAREAALRYGRETGAGGKVLLALARRMAPEHPAEAVKAAETVMHEFAATPDAQQARLLRDGWLRGTPRWEEARQDLEAMVRELGNQGLGAEAQLQLAEGDLAAQPSAARERARALGAQNPTAQASAERVVAESFLRERKFAEAARAFAREASLRGDDEQRKLAMWNSGESYFYGGLFDSAGEAYKALVAQFLRDPRSQEALTRLLLIQDATEESEPALKAYAEAAYQARTHPERADTLYHAVYRSFPKNVAGLEALFQRAELHRKQSDTPGALQMYLVFADTSLASPRAPEALYQAAEICRARLKDSRRALDLYADLVTRFPESWLSPDARRWVERLRREGGL